MQFYTFISKSYETVKNSQIKRDFNMNIKVFQWA